MAVEISKETSRNLIHGHTTVGTSPKRLTDADIRVERGVLLRTPGSADPNENTAPVWVGWSHVTADSNSQTGGMPLPPGESLFVPIEEASLLYVVSTSPGQDIAWMAI